MNQTERLYLRDFGELIREMALDAKKQATSADAADRSYELGRLMAFHEVVALMLSQAKSFDLSSSAIGLDGIDPDRDLL